MPCYLQRFFRWACLMGLCLPALAWSDDITPQQDPHGVTYVTGGIGEEEVVALEPYKKQFRLYLMFTEGSIGRVIEDVDVQIVNAQQQLVFSIAHAAPRLMLNLPAGKYTIIARNQGEKIRHVLPWKDQKAQRIILNWPRVLEDEPDDGQGEPTTSAINTP